MKGVLVRILVLMEKMGSVKRQTPLPTKETNPLLVIKK